MQTTENSLTILLISTTSIILLLAALIIIQLAVYQKNKFAYHNNLNFLKLEFENDLISSQLEIQESISQNIGREIHDNINLSLTLAKLHLNTLNILDKGRAEIQLNATQRLISESIECLTNISRSLNTEIISTNGLVWAVKNEISRLSETNLFRIKFELLGEQIQLNDQKEIIIFRIIQEAFNNILKHSDCKKIHLIISYTQQNIQISIEDDGKGFLSNTTKSKQGAAGLKNMQSRTKILAGTMELQSSPGEGTKLTFKIPF